MESSSSNWKQYFLLGAVALLCFVPFLIASQYLSSYVDQVDTLPYDDYRDLRWLSGGQGVLFLHQPLEGTEEQGSTETELWYQDAQTYQFRSQGKLPKGYHWKLSKRYTETHLVLEALKGEETTLALVSRDQVQPLEFLEIPEPWKLVKVQGRGLFYAQRVNDLPFDQFADVEAAPEVMNGVAVSDWTPTRAGVKIGRYDEETGEVASLLAIPYEHKEERPRVLLLRESPDQRFLALVLRFGKSARPGLWIYDRETDRLLWTRVFTDTDLQGLDWSPDSVSVALSDGQGLVILESALGIEFTRYKTESLDRFEPFWAQNGSLLLVDGVTIRLFDPQAGQAELLVDSRTWEDEVGDLQVGPLGSRVVALSEAEHKSGIVWLEVSGGTESMKRSVLPGSYRAAAQEHWMYKFGEVFRYARNTWLGKNRSSEG